MRLWWVSMSLFMELEGEQGVVIFSCCSSNGIPHWLMRLERSEELVLVSSSFTSSTSSNSWKRDMVDSLVRSISTSIQLLSMEAEEVKEEEDEAKRAAEEEAKRKAAEEE